MKRIISIAIVSIMLLASMTIVAAAAETIKISDPDGGMTRFTISNVDRYSDPNIDGIRSYYCEGKTVVTLVEKDTEIFQAHTMKKSSAGYYERDEKLTSDNDKFTLSKPGVYFISARDGEIAKAANAIIVVEKLVPKQIVVAIPTASKVVVNGQVTAFDAYNIDGNNYFKLRDIATVVSGSEKQFEVSWDAAKKAINLVSNQPYTAVGGEMSEGDGLAKSGVLNKAAIYKDGETIELTAYNINGNNYFKLRDLGETFNFGVSWDGINKSVMIDTTAVYVAE